MKSLVQFIYEEQSKPTIEWMKEHYVKYNKELFNNELPSNVRLGLIKNKNETALGWQGFEGTFWMFKSHMRQDMYIMLIENSNTRYMVGRKNNYPNPNTMDEVKNIEDLKPFIELNPLYQFSDFQKEDTMIHEMIHLWVHRNGLSPKRTHGKEFKRKCDEIREKAYKLYGKKYDLLTYAKKHEEEDKSYQIAKDIEGKITDEITKAAKRGGGVWSIYALYDVKKINEIRLVKLSHRFMFCTKNRLEKVIEQLKKSSGIKEIWISPTAYAKMCSVYGIFATVNNYCKFWDTKAGDYDEKYLYENAIEILKSKSESALESLNEGLGSKIKNLFKWIMGAFLKVTKETPASEINNEEMLNLIDDVENEEKEIKSSPENQKKEISID